MRNQTHLLFRRIRVIESYNELPFVHLCEILIQDSGFGVSDVQITAGFGRESCYNFTLFSILEAQSEFRCRLIGTRFVRFSVGNASEHPLRGFERLQMIEPSKEVEMLAVLQQPERFNISWK
jgi:hypothetical protein